MNHDHSTSGLPRFFTSEMILLFVAIVAGIGLIWHVALGDTDVRLQVIEGTAFTLSLVGFIRLQMDPDSVRARQSDAILRLASQTLDATKEGLTPTAAQTVCELLLPATAAIAVAVTDKEKILGYAGYSGYAEGESLQNKPIITQATHKTIEDAQGRILYKSEDIGFPTETRIRAAIISPLFIGSNIVGTLKFYYRRPRHISQTQRSVAEGFAELISTQMAAAALEEQTQHATSMELKALQAQINPHFLFNTINAIASCIRTDPARARILLRDFASFYRHTLEDSSDLITLSREVDQVKRYFSLEVARFGEERLELVVDIPEHLNTVLVPSFMLQPMVENAVRHALPAEGKLIVHIVAFIEDTNLIIRVEDDGIGMSEETRENIMSPSSTTGLGIAVKNVSDRLEGYFGSDARMEIESTQGVGTVVSFILARNAIDGALPTRELKKSIIPETHPLSDTARPHSFHSNS